jgi:NAD(P)-dependent dehydrogenase (short-subunit alcohol dehydrogenase family)
MKQDSTNSDPRQAGPKPPFPQQHMNHPGSDKKLDPPADHGETSYEGHGRLKDRVAIITGGDSGIGRAVAIAFAKEGTDVILSYLPEEETDAAETAKHVKSAGRRAIQVPGNIKDSATSKKLVETAQKEFGRLDIVVNNAAFQMVREDIAEVSPEELENTFHTNMFGTFFLSQAALPVLQPGASIINTCSIEAFTPEPGLLAYAATKAALVNFTKGLSKLAAKKGVRVNGVAPGPVWTPLIPSTMPEEKVKSFGKNTLFERPAQPIEIARLYVFLASSDATYVSGEIYGATGGRMPV